MKFTICTICIFSLFLSVGFAEAQSLPNKKLTPGAVRTTSAKDVCSGVSTKAYRHTTASMKKKVCAEYGIQKGCPGKAQEIDHLISLELGGADDIKNLWPEKYSPIPGAHQKDLVENYLHKQVCAGAITLPEAQREISTNWLAVYRKMAKSQQASAVRSR